MNLFVFIQVNLRAIMDFFVSIHLQSWLQIILRQELFYSLACPRKDLNIYLEANLSAEMTFRGGIKIEKHPSHIFWKRFHVFLSKDSFSNLI